MDHEYQNGKEFIDALYPDNNPSSLTQLQISLIYSPRPQKLVKIGSMAG